MLSVLALKIFSLAVNDFFKVTTRLEKPGMSENLTAVIVSCGELRKCTKKVDRKVLSGKIAHCQF